MASTDPPQNIRIVKIIAQGSLEDLEAEVKSGLKFLKELRPPLVGLATLNQYSQHWIQQIEALQKEVIEAPIIIGVVGNTGAGKSSIINAILDEERLVPTNCMRACTAVVTEISWNNSNDENAKYLAETEFIQVEDWERELRVLSAELLERNGNVSRDCNNMESEAGVAYTKIKAVYPQKTKEELVRSEIEQLMQETGVREVLGTVKTVKSRQLDLFYTELQQYVDSREKTTGNSTKKMEFWPLIKVVRICTKAEALSTGAVIVDLPSVHDSNNVRATVAERYMKQCTGLWITAPINRAVDDKAAKNLLGESFKRQLKYDGAYSRITFICTKTDDISITEVSGSLDLDGEMFENWARVDQITKDISILQQSIEEFEESKPICEFFLDDVKDQLKTWGQLKRDLENGKTVVASSNISKKRKRSAEAMGSRKERNYSGRSQSHDNEEEATDMNGTAEELPNSPGGALTAHIARDKIRELRFAKRSAHRQRVHLGAKIKSEKREVECLEKEKGKIEAQMSARCVAIRNHYSKGAIQQDFAAGIKEMDQENTVEDDENSFNPEEDLRDYDKVACSLPVFCVSSRAYQKLSGRLKRDPDVPRFESLAETEIPDLRAHCKKLTEAGRASSCRRFLNSLMQLMNSLSLWICDDGTGPRRSDIENAVEERFLQSYLQKLENALGKAVQDCSQEIGQILARHIFEKCSGGSQLAINEAPATAAKWGAPINRENRAAGGYYWATYKALCRRQGVLSNGQGRHDMNQQLVEPIMKQLANTWDKVFSERLPQALNRFAKSLEMILQSFHQGIISRVLQSGAGVTGVALLGQQVRNYQAVFVDLAKDMLRDVNAHQREANRAFAPVIARKLASAYKKCAAETGTEQYMRMKSHMTTQVEICRSTMFGESCEEVKSLLTQMGAKVEKSMFDKAKAVFQGIHRDCHNVLHGERPRRQLIPSVERQMRAEIAKLIQARECGAEEAEEA